MEQREEKKKKTSPSSLPLDICSDILSRLPAKSVVRFGCVSKLWSSIITTDPYFTKEFETRSSTRPSLLMIFREKERGKLFAFSVPQHQQNSTKPRSYSQHVGTYHMKNPKNRYFGFTECVKGFVCFQDSGIPVVWNPSIRKFLTLPKPEKSWPNNVSIRVFLGYDPIEGKHKVVCLPPYSIYEECRVLTLGSTQESWRTVRTNYEHFDSDARNGRCINGVLYYKADDSTDMYKCIIMSFDVRSEKFDMIELPYEYVGGIIIPYEGRLASVNRTHSGRIKLWILEDAKKHKWSRIYFDALKHDESLKTNLKLNGITDAGEFIYVQLRFDRSFYILYYDPKRNSFRKVEFEGIADEEFMRINGLEDISMCKIIDTIPNYVESLMSF